MGTKKYPVENDYNQYLSAHSGSSNAYTASTSTNYHFEVSAKPSNDEEPSATNPSPLYGALDRFAQFFVEPLFLENTLDRELRAVDSENKKNLQSDQWRLHQLEKSLSNPKHPFCHFSTGNLETLKTLPEARGINVRDKFIEFYEKHYSANRMKLCILGREPLDLLEAWVSEFFCDVKNKDLAPNRWPEEVPLTKDHLGIQYSAKPVMDSRELVLSFPFLDEHLLFESQPSRYLSHLIGHEGPGSIMAYIKGMGWVNSLSAGSSPVCPGSPAIFECSMRLTEEVPHESHAPADMASLTPSTGSQELQGNHQGLLSVYCPLAGDGAPAMDLRGTKRHGRRRFQIQAKDPVLPLHLEDELRDATASAPRVAAERGQEAPQV
jgi:insulysin